MILVREVFSIDPDQMKHAKELMREYRGMVKKFNHPQPKIMTDLVADHYTMVMETEFRDMAEFQTTLDTVFGKPEWQQFYPSFRKLMRGGRREIYSLID
jgi:predicted choloylglycine hydrolase